MKTFCRACGEGILYGLKKPICCPFCSESLGAVVAVVNPTPSTVINVKPEVKNKPVLTRRDQEVHEEDDGIDIEDIVKKASVSDWFGVEITNTARADTIGSLAKNDVKAAKEIKAKAKSVKKGKDLPADEILKEFRKEAGTRGKTSNVEEVSDSE